LDGWQNELHNLERPTWMHEFWYVWLEMVHICNRFVLIFYANNFTLKGDFAMLLITNCTEVKSGIKLQTYYWISTALNSAMCLRNENS
jgi:hypothetical protein